jgi:hypothetical protein
VAEMNYLSADPCTKERNWAAVGFEWVIRRPLIGKIAGWGQTWVRVARAAQGERQTKFGKSLVPPCDAKRLIE